MPRSGIPRLPTRVFVSATCRACRRRGRQHWVLCTERGVPRARVATAPAPALATATAPSLGSGGHGNAGAPLAPLFYLAPAPKQKATARHCQCTSLRSNPQARGIQLNVGTDTHQRQLAIELNRGTGGFSSPTSRVEVRGLVW